MRDEIRRCYQVLEIEVGSSEEAVKTAYRELVKVWHPDRFPNDPKLQERANFKSKELNRAFHLIKVFLSELDAERKNTVADQRSPQARETGPNLSEVLTPNT